MSIFTGHQYPYTDFHELNLDWIIEKIKQLGIDFKNFSAVNQIKMGGAWNITTQYSRYTIIDNGGTGYISIKDVPAGITIDNEEYWRYIADYSVIVAGLQQRVINVENRMNAVDSAVSRLDKTIPGKFIAIGDSYGLDDPAASGGTPWSKYVINHFPNAVRSCEGGTGFAVASAATNHKWLEMLQEVVANMEDPLEVTKILVMGGANDAVYLGDTVSENELKNSINTFCSYVKTTMPNATIYLAFIGNNHRNVNVYYDRFRWCRKIYRDSALINDNLTYCSDGEYILCDPTKTIDFLHPTQNASNSFGVIAIGILSGAASFHMIYQNQPIPTAVSGFVQAGLAYSFGKYGDGGYDYVANGTQQGSLEILCNNQTTFNSAGVEVMTYSDFPLSGFPVNIPVFVIDYATGTENAGFLSFTGGNSDGKTHVKVHTYKSLTINANNRIRIPSFSVHIPYFYAPGSHDF